MNHHTKKALALAAQEVVIALTDGPQTFGPLRRFALSVALGSVLVLALLAATPLADLYLREITGVSAQLARFAVSSLRCQAGILKRPTKLGE